MNFYILFGILCVGVAFSKADVGYGIVTDTFNKKCAKDSDCLSTQCCAKGFLTGYRCRHKLQDGETCQNVITGILREKCPCAEGLVCTQYDTFVGVKRFKCKQEGS